MIYTYEAAKREAVEATRRAAGAEVGLSLAIPPAGVAADLAIPCFPLAAALRAAPQEIATRLAGAMKLGPLLESAHASGGYLNVTFARAAFAAGVMGDLRRLGDRYGSNDAGGGRTVVIDFSAPNVARQMSVGHLRSTIIGAALYELHKFADYRPIGDNHLGRSEEHTSELQSRPHLVCRLLLEKKKKTNETT